MSADITTVLVAVIGVAGTLTSPLLGQRIAARVKQQEFELQRQQRHEESEEAQRRTAFEERRSCCAGLNTAARQYQQQLEAYLRMITADAISDEGRAELAEARERYRQLYSDAQMILPDKLLDGAASVSARLGESYGRVKRLEIGKPRAESADSPAETIESTRNCIHVTLYNEISGLRHLMRQDLGVSDPGIPNHPT